MADPFAFSQYFTVGAVGVFVDDALVGVSNSNGVPGGIVVVNVELIALCIDKGHQPQAVDVVAGDGAATIGFGEQVATGTVEVLRGTAIAGGAQAIADAVVVVAVGLAAFVVGHQAMALSKW